jgi:hypothetical protein
MGFKCMVQSSKLKFDSSGSEVLVCESCRHPIFETKLIEVEPCMETSKQKSVSAGGIAIRICRSRKEHENDLCIDCHKVY